MGDCHPRNDHLFAFRSDRVFSSGCSSLRASGHPIRRKLCPTTVCLAPPQNTTPLHLAASRGAVEVVRLLLHAWPWAELPNVDPLDSEGRSPDDYSPLASRGASSRALDTGSGVQR